MATKCFTPLLGKRIRVINLDACGNLPTSGTANSVLATDGFVTLTLSSEVDDGAEILTKKADGSICVNERLSSSFKRFTVGIEFCGVNPSLLSMITNANAYNDYAGNVAGFTVREGTIAKQFALELWTGIAGGNCTPGVAFSGGYLLLPFVSGGVIGDLEFNGESATNFSLTGGYTKGGNNWGVGPYNVVLASGAANEQQTITITGTPTGGTFTLTFQGQTTSNIAFNASAATVQSALLALSNMHSTDVVVTGGPGPGTPWVATFQGAYANVNVTQMTATSSLTGGTAPAVTVTTTTPGSAGASSPLPTAVDTNDHLLMMQTTLTPPVSACSPVAMP
jgi:hypothetical protein